VLFVRCIAWLLLLSACATTEPRSRAPVARGPRLANLQRAATLPWRDGGRCVVQESSLPWPQVVERCFHSLDTRKVRFRDTGRRCPVASADAASLEMMVGICLLTQPELVVGAVVILGAVVVAVAIAEELHAYELEGGPPDEATPVSHVKLASRESAAERRPEPEPSGQDWLPPVPREPSEQERRPERAPQPVPHLGGDAQHNRCADRVPLNGFPGSDVLVNGKRFDALQLRARVLWEVKTDNFESYASPLQKILIEKQVTELLRERALARACGFDFRVGVRSASHEAALLRTDPTFDGAIVVMDWC
jgi:hypothetical protein